MHGGGSMGSKQGGERGCYGKKQVRDAPYGPEMAEQHVSSEGVS